MWWLLICEQLVACLLTLAASRYFIHMLQLESYQLDGYMRWLRKDANNMFGWTFKTGVSATVAFYVLPVLISMFVTGERQRSSIISTVVIMIFVAVYGAYMIFKDFGRTQKKPLVFTKRVKRLYAVLTLTAVVICALMVLISGRYDALNAKRAVAWLSPYLLIAVCPYVVMLAGYLAKPIEDKINRSFFVKAQNKLKSLPKMKKIGITGSYGKTSAKYCLAAILSEKYKVFYPKASINTPMGLSKVINEELTDDMDVFIAEMGARHVGDIKELVELVHPEFGMITSVGPQHLETFKTVEIVANTKYELIEGLPKTGKAFFAADGSFVDKLYERCKIKKFRAGISDGYLDMHAEDVEVGAFGSRFTLMESDGSSIRVETKLLGRHNISNIVLCCQVAREIGMTLPEIAEGVKRIKPVKHRLQLIAGAMNVIDDAFNSNPVGAKEALNVLHSFPGKHLIITPGFVEMGENEDKFNYELGTHIAETCDAAILVGPKHTSPIRQGMLDRGFDEKKIMVVNTLDEAAKKIPMFASNGDAVLFENDLPDNYTEK
ncbi:MAG: UDP-N-acetylmuramoyl-tripeptide--D-alanyl-D-alanine ligase [Clostridia bacterium]|nr:UDP-N-acetylmuramoyl-tripeptide--D-alanyl-D-alanine ligase [Clostridia bacterium]